MSSKPHSEHMSYGIEKSVEKLQFVVTECQSDLQKMSEVVLKQQKDLEAMRIQLEEAQAEICFFAKRIDRCY